MNASLLLVPICGGITFVGLLLAVAVGLILNRVLSKNASTAPTTATVISTGAGLAVFVIWFILAWLVVGAIGTIMLNQM